MLIRPHWKYFQCKFNNKCAIIFTIWHTVWHTVFGILFGLASTRHYLQFQWNRNYPSSVILRFWDQPLIILKHVFVYLTYLIKVTKFFNSTLKLKRLIWIKVEFICLYINKLWLFVFFVNIDFNICWRFVDTNFVNFKEKFPLRDTMCI